MEINIDKIKKEKPISELLEFCIFNIDKPSGPTSFWVDSFIKAKLNAKKISHGGTLDPAVGGVLPILCNRACRLSDYFMHKNKTYVGIMRVHKKIDEKKLKEEMNKFTGKIKQLPPVKSRVKREEREREVYYWKILEIEDDKNKNGINVLFETEVEAGTYIRKLCSELGEKIGGAHMLELRRVKAGIFSEEDENFVNLYEFEKAVDEANEGKEENLRKIIIPGEIISKILPIVQVKKQAIKALYTGKFLNVNQTDKKEFGKDEKIALFNDNTFIGIYSCVSEETARPEFVMVPLK